MIKEYGYEYDAVLDEKLYNKTKGKVTNGKYNGAFCLRSGRDALKAIAREFDPTIVLMPALACDSMLHPFKIYGHTIVYYELKSDYSINIERLTSLIPDVNRTILFLFMDYFGNRAADDTDLIKIKATYPNLVFIEDRTHNLFVEKKYSFQPDYTLASLRKWIDIPDGGLLWTSRDLKNKEYSTDVKFSETRLYAQCLRNEFLRTGNEEIKAVYRKIFSTVTEMIDNDRLPGLMSQYSYERVVNADIKSIKAAHQQNAKILIDELQGCTFIQDKAGLGDIYVGILVYNRDELQKKLASIGVFCTIIWPLNEKQRLSCEIAKYTEKHMLAIYCDQRYSVEDMKYVAACIRRFYHEKKDNDFRGKYFTTSSD